MPTKGSDSMPRKYTEKRKESNRKWDAENLDRMSFVVRKGEREQIKAAASNAGKSVSEYVRDAIAAQMERDAAK